MVHAPNIIPISTSRQDSADVCKLELLRQLARSEKEIAAGTGHDLDSVLKDADAILKKK